jgi:ketosteroid isomerase-like protein
MPNYTVKSNELKVEVSDSGDLGYLIGEHYSVSDDTGEELGRWKHLFVWKKVDGDWKISAVSMNGKPVEES